MHRHQIIWKTKHTQITNLLRNPACHSIPILCTKTKCRYICPWSIDIPKTRHKFPPSIKSPTHAWWLSLYYKFTIQSYTLKILPLSPFEQRVGEKVSIQNLLFVYPLRGTQLVTDIWRLTSWIRRLTSCILLRGPSQSVERYLIRDSFTFLSHQLWRTSESRNIGKLFHGPWRYMAARTGQPAPSTMLLFKLP